jgi:putative ABC transport system permease protein
MAIGVVLLVAAGLLLRSLHRLWQTDPGFDAQHVVTAKVDLPDKRYPYLKQIAFYDDVVRDLKALPDVQMAAAVAPLPFSGGRYGLSFEQPGVSAPRSRRPSTDFVMVGPGYFRLMAMPFVQGRDLSEADTDAAPRVVVVNESFVRQFLESRNPIGERIKLSLSTTEPDMPWREIVGVVRDARIRALNELPRPTAFIPYSQGLIGALFLVIRTHADPSTVIGETRAVIAKQDSELALYSIRTIEEYVAQSVATPRFQTVLLSLFAGLALILTAVGLYGVVAYGVAQRTREFGIRIALGAEPRTVVRLVLRDAAVMAAGGVAFGFLASIGATRFMGSALYGIHRFDPITFGGVAVTLFAAVLVASVIPARRAARIDPIRALRTE